MEPRLIFPKKSHSLSVSRRRMVIGGLFAGASSAVGLSALAARPAAANDEAAANDAAILNGALYYEHQAIWAYSAAAGFLSDTEVGKAVLKLALANQADHKTHRDTLAE
ncbi:MAG: ferritin-like domain-containing protein, partial [Cyanobacteria bacterium Co-bin13]|nr:ferritin-like domain-containing protein [Cyanobacteria bacterium Co-bin13]